MSAPLHDLIALFATFGATAGGGVGRLTATPEDQAARDRLAAEITMRGLHLTVDPIGNMFGTAQLAPTTSEAVLTGSHLDSQATGGRYDGTYGVLAGLLAVAAVAERARLMPGTARRNLALVNWTNEEGARFQPSLTGSSVFAGLLPREPGLMLPDGTGQTLGAALAAIGYQGTEECPVTPCRYVELHVEQGPQLETAGIEIGIVEAAWAACKLSLVFHGAPSHTGPTPMPQRRDALRAAAMAITLLYQTLEADGHGAHGSAARITVTPNSPNVVPERVQVWFEIRHPEDQVTTAIGAQFQAAVTASASHLGIEIEIAREEQRATAFLDSEGAEIVQQTAQALGYTTMRLRTVSGHDALAIQQRLPASLIFVPSQGGLSHTPEEFTAPADLDRGLAVLTETLWRLVTA